MTDLDQLHADIAGAVARGHYECIVTLQKTRGVTMPPWDEQPPLARYHITQASLDAVKPAFSIIDHAIMQAAEEASILRMRLDLFIDELKGRGDAVLAAELTTVINPKD